MNLAGAEFGENCLPGVEGRDYLFNSDQTFAYFGRLGLRLFRIPFLWERLQPRLSGPLDPPYLAGLRRNVESAARHGAGAILDLHNFGRYQQVPVGSGAVTIEAFADVWERLSVAFAGMTGIWAYGLMNEPHDMDRGAWQESSQAAVEAIRRRGDATHILVAGLRWSNAHVWPQVNGKNAWITDPHANFAYEAHVYFDREASGRYAHTFDEEERETPELLDIGVRRFEVFRQWCERNGVRGMIGEFGAPNTDPRWLSVMRRFLDAVEAAGMDATYWAAGEWWNDYTLSIQPRGAVAGHPPQLPPQLTVLCRELPPS